MKQCWRACGNKGEGDTAEKGCKFYHQMNNQLIKGAVYRRNPWVYQRGD